MRRSVHCLDSLSKPTARTPTSTQGCECVPCALHLVMVSPSVPASGPVSLRVPAPVPVAAHASAYGYASVCVYACHTQKTYAHARTVLLGNAEGS